MTCPSCGADVPVGARFCPTCGHNVQGPGDQRRVVTVLFADLAGFTGLSETRDPESVKNLVDQCFAALAADVTDHGGRVDKVVGDAIIALFGAPRANEDDAERAVRAGLEMQRTISRMAAEVGADVRLRVGINTGEVLVGALRAGGDYTAMGDVVNVASRLQTSAERGMVVVGQPTWSATNRVVEYRDLGLLQARGREEPVQVWEAVGCDAPPGRRPRRAATPLIGRDRELSVLRQSVASAIGRRRPTLLVLVGDAGIGKSRITEELTDWAGEHHDALVLEGRCVPYGEANPWWPVAEAVRRACGIEGGDPADVARTKCREAVAGAIKRPASDPDVDRLAAGLMHLMGDEDALPDVDPQRARQWGRKALNALVSGLAGQRPVIIVLSEMHWADDLVLELVGSHLDRQARLPVTMVITGRPELLDRWTPPQGRHNLVVLHVDPLDRDASRQLVDALLEGSAPPGMADTLAERSGGNPLFLEELTSLVAAGTDELPVTLRGIVAARVDRLPAEERSVLEDAAVVGRNGFLFTLRAMSAARQVPYEVDRAVGELVARELLSVQNGRWEFRSDVVREVVYDTLTKTDRARRHWQLAVWITSQTQRTGREDEYLEQVAHHYVTAATLVAEMGAVADVPDDAAVTAVRALERAATWAARRELLLPAARLFDRAIALAGPQESELRRSLLIERAMVRTSLRELAGAKADIDEAAVGAEGRDRARMLTTLGFLQQTAGEFDLSTATLTEALAAWRQLGDRDGEGSALRQAGMTSLFAGDLQRAEVLLNEALETARQLGQRRDEAWALWHLAYAAFSALDIELAEARLADAQGAFDAAGDTGGVGWVKGLLGYIRLVQGNRDEAERLALSVIDDARDRGDRWAIGMLVVLLGTVRLWRGAVDSAIDLAREASETFAVIDDPVARLRALSLLARALSLSGRINEARAAADQARAVAADPATMGLEPMTEMALLLSLALESGDWRAATDLILDPPSSALVGGEVRAMNALAYLQAGRVADALKQLESAAASAPPGALPHIHTIVALARCVEGRPADALDQADAALRADPEGTYRDIAFAQLARGFALFHLGRSAEAERALQAAAETLRPTEDRLTAAVVRLGAARARQAAGWAGAEHGASGGHEAATADDAVSAAADELAAMGAAGEGWDNLFRAALPA